jgi:hypothetical protein fgonA2_02664
MIKIESENSMKNKKTMPIGIDNFKTLITKNYYYFDKTKMIEELLENDFEVVLFTRPRRFGKSLNMSMLKYFFDVRNCKENKSLFEELYISKSEYRREQGKYPVIYISFKDIKKKNWEETYELIKSNIYDLYYEHRYVLDKLDEIKKEEYNDILLRKKEPIWSLALEKLSEYLYLYYGEKAIILIDEYDTPLIYAYEFSYYEEAINFFRTLYGSALKGNKYLEKGVLTGILRIVREGIFSDLNNLIVYTILDKKYSNYFGLTEKEVEKSLKEYKLIEELEKVKKWYNGYKFGESNIYNPWSIINYLSSGELVEYWVNTSNDNTINRLIKNSQISMFEDLKKIFEGRSVSKIINLTSNMSNLRNPQEIWQLMLFSGYLTISKKISNKEYELKIPNYEVQSFFKDSFINENFSDKSTFNQMINALLDGNMDMYKYYLQQIMLLFYSYHDGDKINEKPYHNLILGSILYLEDWYEIDSNIERGFGRTDLTLTPKDKIKLGYIFEFKVVSEEKDLEGATKEAIKQIKQKKYDTKMRNDGVEKILCIGIAFCGKKVDLNWEKL